MKIVVCVRRGLDGEINPFDACAYEAALRIPEAQITLLSMGPADVGDFLLRLTRLGTAEAVLLCDKAFAGADTLATAYALSLAVRRLEPQVVFCGRQTLVGDTAQTGAMLSRMLGYGLITNVMSIDSVSEEGIVCSTRCEGEASAKLPALVTVERINTLRLPRLRSRLGTLTVWSAADIGADVSRCGLAGSPTRVLKTFENESGKRRCCFIPKEKLGFAISEGLRRSSERAGAPERGSELLDKVCIVGDAPRSFAETVSDNIIVLPLSDAETIAASIKELEPSAVLWGSDTASKRLAAQVAAELSLGLCADCTSLECKDGQLIMYRPALSGSIIAKIKSLTVPAMATVRTQSDSREEVIVTAGFGASGCMDRVRKFASSLGAQLCATRKLVDNDFAPYEAQVGLTGKTVSPPVYITVGVSGAVHHIVGMQRSGTVIAIDPDKNAPIFDYADFGIVDNFENIEF